MAQFNRTDELAMYVGDCICTAVVCFYRDPNLSSLHGTSKIGLRNLGVQVIGSEIAVFD